MRVQVYYMHLLFKALGRKGSLTLLHLRVSEFVVERHARALLHADVYHKLKRLNRFEWIRDRPQAAAVTTEKGCPGPSERVSAVRAAPPSLPALRQGRALLR